MGLAVGALPDFPWDSLTPFAELARLHPDGIVDLSVGTPVDPTPEVISSALVAAADSPGYPATIGTADLRQAIVEWFSRRRQVPDLEDANVLPTIGSKELVALLPSLLGLGAGDAVLHPGAAYPTYDVGARLAGANPVLTDDPAGLLNVRDDIRLVWLNSPGNPTGSVLAVDEMAAIVDAARRAQLRHGNPIVIASDECYAELAWEEPWVTNRIPSILDPRVTRGDISGLLAFYSLSKQSNLAGYRAAFIAGDEALISSISQIRKHIGLMMPSPIQRAMAIALRDDAHVAAQRERYRRRRQALRAAFEGAGYRVDGSYAGLYLWVRPAGAQDPWTTVRDLAALGILTAPGVFYGDPVHIRVALTATDERVSAAVARLSGA